MEEQPNPQHSQRCRLKHPVDCLWCIYPRGGFFFCFVLFCAFCRAVNVTGRITRPLRFHPSPKIIRLFFFLCLHLFPMHFKPQCFLEKCNVERFPGAGRFFWGLRQKGTPKEVWNFGFIVGQLGNCGADTCSCSVLHFTADTHDSLPEHWGVEGQFETSEGFYYVILMCRKGAYKTHHYKHSFS